MSRSVSGFRSADILWVQISYHSRKTSATICVRGSISTPEKNTNGGITNYST
jgi:hypothetical protein